MKIRFWPVVWEAAQRSRETSTQGEVEAPGVQYAPVDGTLALLPRLRLVRSILR